jgi:hypothetical protein
MIFQTLFSVDLGSIVELFGRAGGGGSSSSGGGGGGDGIIIFLGYLPMHFIGSILRKKTSIVVANMLGWIIALIYAAFWVLIWNFIGWLIAIAALVGMAAGLYNWFHAFAKLAGKAKEKHELAVQKDSAWDIEKLKSQVTSTFMQFQTDWSNSNSTAMQPYLTPEYLYHNQLMVLALKQLGRQNLVKNPIIHDMQLVDVIDNDDNSHDRFVMYIEASADDELVNVSDGEILFTDNNNFQEYWRFVRNGESNWLLDGIGQATESPYMTDNEMFKFAELHKYRYSPDWGWLLLPSRGQLFGSGKFGVSDINNHIIGAYNNTLIQLYNYIPITNSNNSKMKNYIIAQVVLPKTYGNIVVRKKKTFSLFGIKGLTKVSMEWGDFNKRYEVWASDMERVTSFELLNPSFMVKLQELPFEVNIEVVDNVVYLYCFKTKVEPQSYETMLTILYQAFKEMRM